MINKRIAVFGDLMFADVAACDQFIQMYQDMVEDIHEECFWLIDQAEDVLSTLGFTSATHWFSDLSWEIIARKEAIQCR